MTAAAPSAKPLSRSATIEMITTGTRSSAGICLRRLEELPAVHVGQHDVQRDQRQRLLRREHQRGLGGGGVQHREAFRLELHADQLRGLVVVLDDQRGARARQRRRGQRGDRRLGRRERRLPPAPAAAARP